MCNCLKQPKLYFQLLNGNKFTPKRGTKTSSGLDVFCPKEVIVEARKDLLLPLDLRFEIPEGWDLAVYNKSGVATKKKLIKGAELIDSDYRGNCHLHVFNMSDTDITIKKGEKITQLVMREVWLGELLQKDEIDTITNRGQGGFGSTGSKF